MNTPRQRTQQNNEQKLLQQVPISLGPRPTWPLPFRGIKGKLISPTCVRPFGKPLCSRSCWLRSATVVARLKGAQYLIHGGVLVQPVTLPRARVMQPHGVEVLVVSGTGRQSTGQERDDAPHVDRVAEFHDVEAA